MNRFFLRIEASVTPTGGANPTLEVLVGGVVVSSAVITAQTGVGSDILFFTLDSDLANYPSSLSFRFNGGTGDPSDVVTLENVRVNGQTVSATDLSAIMLSQGQSSNQNIANTDHLFGRVEPTAADLGTTTQTGTGGDDNITGTGNADVIDGGGGNDRIRGLADDDAINGGTGNDYLFGGDDNDIIIGGAGDDYLVGDAGDDLLYGQADNDILIGAAGNDTLNGGTGDDILAGGDGNDILYGEAGDDRLTGDAGDDILYGDGGADRLLGGAGNDTMYGGTENDLMSGGAGNDAIYGEAGDDLIMGDAGADTIDGGAGNDIIYGGADNDTINGGDNNDIIYGDAGVDTINGGNGVDILVGGAGADIIDGGAGNDIIHGHGLDAYQVSAILRANPNVVFSQETNSFYQFVNSSVTWDTARTNALASTLNGVNGHMVVISSDAENQFIFDLADANGADSSTGAGGNRVWLSATDLEVDQIWRWADGAEAGIQFSSAGTSTNNLYENWGGGQPNNSGGAQVYATMWFNGGANDVTWDDRNAGDTHDYIIEWDAGLMNNDNAADVLSGGAGDDIIYGYGGNDTLNGGDDNDVLFGGAGNDTLNGDAGNDTLVGGAGNDILNGGTGTDFVTYAGAASGVNVNLLTGVVSNDGDGGSDTLISIERLEVTNFDDVVTGDNGNNTIDGRGGNDIIEGMNGNDTLNGGAGIDTASYANAGSGVTANLTSGTASGGAGNDTLLNFENLTGSGFNDTLTGNAGANVIMGNAGNDTITGGAGVDIIDGGDGNDTINLANNDFAAGESLTGGAGTDGIVLTNATTINLSTGTIATIELLTGSSGNDNVTMNAAHFGSFTTINLAGGTDVMNVFADGSNISALSLPTVSNVETGNLVGDGNNNSVTLTGAQLDAIIQGTGTINLGAGASDTINITSTSADLNALGNTDASIQGVEIVSAALATAAVTIVTLGQTENLTFIGGNFDDVLVSGLGNDIINGGAGNDTILAYLGADTVDGGAGDDTLFLLSGDFAAGESLTGGADTDVILLGAAMTVDFTIGTINTVEALTGSAGNDTVTLSDTQWAGFTSIDMAGGTDIINVLATGDISASAVPTVTGLETGNYIGTTGNDNATLTGAQLDAILEGTGIINFDTGANDVMNLTSTSAELNVLGNTDASILGLEQISAAGATGAVDIRVTGQTENFIITGGNFGDIVLSGSGNDTINGGGGNDLLAGFAGSDMINGGAGDDAFLYVNGHWAAGEVVDGGIGTDSILLFVASTIDFSTGTLTSVETFTGSGGNDTITLSASQWAGFTAIDMGGGTDVLNVIATGNISALGTPTFTSAETGNLIGTAGNDAITLTGAQLNAIIIGGGTINLGAGGSDTINITSTSTDLNTLGNTNGSISGVENISASTAAAAVTISLSGQTEGFTITGSASGDTITGGSGVDTINGGDGSDVITGGAGADIINAGNGNDTVNLANGNFAAGESLTGGAGTDTIVLTNATTINLTTGTVTGFEIFTGSSGNDTITLTNSPWILNSGAGNDTVNSGSTLSVAISSIISANSEAILNMDGTITHFFTIAGTDTYTLPTGITSIDVTAWGGGGGGGGGGDNNAGGAGGGAGYVEGTIAVSSGDTLAIAVGGGGGQGLYTGGGGNAEGTGGGGGGYSGVFDTSITQANALFVASAGGGGGGGDNTGGAPDGGAGGASGGLSGSSGTGGGGSVGAGQGGTQVAGGAAGGGNNGSTIAGTNGAALSGGLGGDSNPPTATAGGAAGINGGGEGGQASTSLGRAGGGGGGAGYYGGGGGTASNGGNTSGAGGGGGSNHIDGSATGTTNTGAAGLTPFQNDPYYITGVGVGGTGGALDSNGFNGGNGLVVLSYDMGSITFTTIAGGTGNDALYGSSGMDIFVFSDRGAANVDTVYNFNAQIDKLDLSDLLTGYDPLTEAITDFVQITNSGGNSDLRVDTTGSASFGAATVVATLNGITGLTDEAFHEITGMLIIS